MDFFQALVLGILQGVTEFLPISSSGHLVLGEALLGLEVSELKAFDVVVHLASLLAIVVYFWEDIVGLLRGFWGLLRGQRTGKYGSLVRYIVVGTIPAVIVGFTMEDWIDGIFRNVEAVAGVMIVVAGAFVIGEQIFARFWKGREVDVGEIGFLKAILIGCAQAVALIPGVSRSGSTIVAGLMGGMSREDAARFGFLLGIPAIAGAGLLTFLKLPEGGLGVSAGPLAVGFVASFVAGLVSVWGLMKFLKKHSLIVFAVYLAVLGAGVLV